VKTITIHFDKKLLNQCKRLAKEQNITLSQLVENALRELIKETAFKEFIKIKEKQNGRQI
jgi:metal-responsive CopG/Arc/MetJ family transcriptional regulator